MTPTAAAFPEVAEVGVAEAAPAGRSVLFERVERLAFTDRRAGSMRVETLPLGKITLALVRSTGHDIALDERRRASFLLPVSGRLGIDNRRTQLHAGDGGALWLGTGYRTTLVRAPAAAAFAALVALGPGASRRQAAMPGRSFAQANEHAEVGALAGYCRYLLGEWSRPDSPLRSQAARRASEALLVDLFGNLGGLDSLRASDGVWTPAERVRRAEEIMRDRFDEPLTIEDLAAEVGLSLRVLQLAFRTHRGISPRGRLNAIRMERAREMLAATRPAASVTDVALACGFAHFGRFASVYRERYGEAPSETLRRARG
jgi:AraC-like DNA-binding protein